MLPSTAAPFFQEYTFTKLNAEKDASLIIERLLAYGNRAELRWMFERYGHARVKEWLAESGARRLPKRRYHMWCVLLDVPEDFSKRRQIWPY